MAGLRTAHLRPVPGPALPGHLWSLQNQDQDEICIGVYRETMSIYQPLYRQRGQGIRTTRHQSTPPMARMSLAAVEAAAPVFVLVLIILRH